MLLFGIEEYKTHLDPRIKWLQDNVEEGVPLEDLLKVDRAKLTYNSISEDVLREDSELQKKIAREYYKETTRFSDSRIDKEIERLDQLGDLSEETIGYLSELKNITEQKEEGLRNLAKQQQEQARAQQLQILEDFQNTLKSTKEVIPGLPVNDVTKDKIYKSLTTVVGIDEYGNPLNNIAMARSTDPIGFEIKLAYLFEITKGLS